jgi:P27 family predicted phage terminase small subunit
MATGRPNGRPPKPIEQKRKSGNPGHRPLPDPPAVGKGLPAATKIPNPPSLGLDGLELWKEIWTEGKTWLSPEADQHFVIMLCQAHDEAAMIRRALDLGEVKRFYVLSNGQQVTHPYVKQLQELRSQMTAWLSSLGFSPTDRARLGLTEVRQADALDELTRRRAERKTVNG